MRFFLFFATGIFLLFTSCKKTPKAEPAFFIQCGEVKVLPDAKQGTSSHKITDLWFYVNGQFQGAYPTGHILPIVSKGEPVELNFFAGIKNNGISGTRIFYPFYDILSLDTVVDNGRTIARDFGFKYKSSTVFAWNEDFENGTGFTVEKSPDSWVSFYVAPPSESFEGRSIFMKLSGDSILGQLQSTSSFTLPSGSSDVFLELNYKCNEDFVVSLIGENGVWKDALNIAPQENWNKIYIQLSEPVSTAPVSKTYKVGVKLKKLGALDPWVYLDNFKILHF